MRTPLPTPEDDHDRTMLENIEGHGWHVVGVQPEGQAPGWCFTVGLYHSYDHPELMLFGLPQSTGQTLLNIGGERIKTGARFEADRPYDDFVQSYRCILRPVQRRWLEPFLGYGLWFYQDTEFPVMQLFWPDRDGVMPWEPAASDWHRAHQPLLYEPDAEAARTTELLSGMIDELEEDR